MHRAARLVVLVSLLSACGGGSSPSVSPTPVPSPAPSPVPSPAPAPAPTPPPTVATIAGTWTGRILANHSTGPTQYSVEVTLQQSDRQVTGTWTQPGGTNWRGEIAGTLSGFGVETTIQGTTTWDAETSAGTGRCLARATISGSASLPTMTWTSADVTATNAGCSGTLTNVRWMLARP